MYPELKGHTVNVFKRETNMLSPRERWWGESRPETEVRFNIKMVFPGIYLSVINVGPSWDGPIFIMGIPILVRRLLYTAFRDREAHPWKRTLMKFELKCETFQSRKCIWKRQVFCKTATILFILHMLYHGGFNSSPLDKMAGISQTIFSDEFSWMKSFAFWSKFHLSFFLMLIPINNNPALV